MKPWSSPSTSNYDRDILEDASRLVQALRARTSAALDDPNTEVEIGTLIENLDNDRDMVDVNGVRYSASRVAMWKLYAMGEAGIPQLLEGFRRGDSVEARQVALYTIGCLHRKTTRAHDDEYLGLYALAASDPEGLIRATAITWIAEMARNPGRDQADGNERLIPYLQKALGDPNDLVQMNGALGLWRIGRKDLVPPDLVKKYELGTSHYD